MTIVNVKCYVLYFYDSGQIWFICGPGGLIKHQGRLICGLKGVGGLRGPFEVRVRNLEGREGVREGVRTLGRAHMRPLKLYLRPARVDLRF